MTPRRPTFRPRSVIIGAVVTLIVVVLGAGVYLRITGQNEADAAEPATASGPVPSAAASAFAADMAIPVEGARVVRDTLVISVTAAGEAASWRQTLVTAQIAGRISAISVRENDVVAEGQSILQIDAAEYELAVASAQAGLRSAQSAYEALVLGVNDVIANEADREANAVAARARSGLDAAEVALQRAQLDLSRTRVLAPFSGRVANLKVVPGQWVGAGVELMTVVDLDPIKVEVQVLEGEVGYMSAGREATVTFAAFPSERFTGRIATINPMVERDRARTARVTVLIPNPGGRILPGMYAQVALQARRYPDRILIPRAALLERDRRNVVMMYEGDEETGRSKWRYINPGLANDSMVEILSPSLGAERDSVLPGEIVLIDGQYSLQHDARIRLVDDVAAAGGRPR